VGGVIASLGVDVRKIKKVEVASTRQAITSSDLR